jgi:hypothetical protein
VIEPKLLSRKDTALLLGVCEATVDNMLDRGELERSDARFKSYRDRDGFRRQAL